MSVHVGTNESPVAFTAYASADRSFPSGETLSFDAIITNIRSHYDALSSSFTCPVTGLYMFTMSIFSEDGHRTEAVMRLDGSILVSTYAVHTYGNEATNIVFQLCQTGNIIDIVCGPKYTACQIDSNDYLGITTFSGILIYTI